MNTPIFNTPTDIHITHHFDLEGCGLRELLDELREILNKIEEKEKKYIVDVTKVPVEKLPLSVRCINCLKAADLYTLGDVTNCTRWQLLKLRNFGRKALSELDKIMDEYGLTFRTER